MIRGVRDDGSRNAARNSLRRQMAAGGLVAFILVGGLGGWAATTELDGAVIARGQLVVSGNVKQVQHRDGGIVREILASNGTRVKAGQELLRLDDTVPKSNLAIVEAQIVDLVAKRYRLRAEQLGAPEMAVPTNPEPGLETLAGDFSAAFAAELALFHARRTTLEGQRAGIGEESNQIRAGVRGLEAKLAATRDQIKLIGEEIVSSETLMSQGLTTQRQLSALRRSRAELTGMVGQLETDISQSNIAVSRNNLKMLQIDLDQRAEAEGELREVAARIAELAERRTAARDQLDRLVVRAPQDGVVDQLAMHTVGGVIAAGDTIALIVPDRDQLVVEAQIRPTEIDQVLTGQAARIRLQTMDARSASEFVGVVTTVSADVVAESVTRETHYLVRIKITDEARLRKERLLVSGMPVDVFLATTDSRTALGYLLEPLIDQFAYAMRET